MRIILCHDTGFGSLMRFASVYCTERHSSKLGRFLTFVVIAVVLGAGIAGYIFYKYRLRVCGWNLAYKFSINKIIMFPFCVCSHTWTQRLWLSCRSTCLLTITIRIRLSNTRLSLYEMARQYEEEGRFVRLNRMHASVMPVRHNLTATHQRQVPPR